MEFLEEFSGSTDQIIIKGTRTKRPRPSSSSMSSGSGAISNNSILIPFSTDSSVISTSTEEDEELANCLILLAKSCSPPPKLVAENKLSSRKFTEMPTTTNGKVGIYIYECKTCNRTFSSFQALGGHRASHKRSKATAGEIDRKISPLPPSPPQNNQEDKKRGSLAISVQLPNTKAKIHECSICGSEFASGQALGGHMRRHRSASNCSNKRSGTSTDNDTSSYDVSQKAGNMLTLDLNLPAQPEDDHGMFSAVAPPLEDCHY